MFFFYYKYSHDATERNAYRISIREKTKGKIVKVKYFLKSAENYLIMTDIIMAKKYLSLMGKIMCKLG